MDDRQSHDREHDRKDQTAPTTPGHEQQSQNGRRSQDDDDEDAGWRSDASKPPLTERERRDRWPVD